MPLGLPRTMRLIDIAIKTFESDLRATRQEMLETIEAHIADLIKEHTTAQWVDPWSEQRADGKGKS